MKTLTLKQFLIENIAPQNIAVKYNSINEGFLSAFAKGFHGAMDAANKATYSIAPREILPKPQDNIHTNGVDVNRLNLSHVSHFHVHAHFQPTHNIKVHIPGSSHVQGTSVVYVAGNELGSNGPQIYRKDHTGNYTKIDHVRLIHENPDIVRTHIGQHIYNANKEAFSALPLTASRGDMRRIMSMNPNDRIGSNSVKSLQTIALNHYNSTPENVTHLLNNQNVDQMVLQKAIIKHGLNKQQAHKLLQHPNVTHSVLRDAAQNALNS